MNIIFHSLADPTRRDIIGRAMGRELSVGELVENYAMSFPAVSKHLKVLEQSQLIIRRKDGRNIFITANIRTLQQVDVYLERYRQMWEQRFNKLDQLLDQEG